MIIINRSVFCLRDIHPQHVSNQRRPRDLHQVCVCGGAGGIGQPLSMLMALDPNVKDVDRCTRKRWERWNPTPTLDT